MQSILHLMSDGSECIPYNVPDYPMYVRKSALRRKVPPHWHDDLEFSYIFDGRMNYFVNGEVMTLASGQGIFVNARQLHGNYCEDGEVCDYGCLLVHPSLLGIHPYLQENCVDPLTHNPAFSHAVLTGEVPWQREVLDAVAAACEAHMIDEPAMAMVVQARAFQIAAQLLLNMPAPDRAVPVDRRLLTLRDMVGFVQQHYACKVSLNDIAEAGHVSVSTCCDIFKRHMHRTPLSYLTHYRLEKAVERLKNPGLSVTEVALSVGFFSASYFSETFRKAYGISPSQWRNGQGGKPV